MGPPRLSTTRASSPATSEVAVDELPDAADPMRDAGVLIQLDLRALRPGGRSSGCSLLPASPGA